MSPPPAPPPPANLSADIEQLRNDFDDWLCNGENGLDVSIALAERSLAVLGEVLAALRAPTAPQRCPQCGDTPNGTLRCPESTRGRCPMSAPTAPPADLVALVMRWKATHAALEADKGDFAKNPHSAKLLSDNVNAFQDVLMWTPPALGTPLAAERAIQRRADGTELCGCEIYQTCEKCRPPTAAPPQEKP